MQNKLKHYLGTELVLEYQVLDPSLKTLSSELIGLDFEKGAEMITTKDHNLYKFYMHVILKNPSFTWDGVKPHLRPLRKLVEPIVVKGYNDDKEFVPIIELARIEGCSYDYETGSTTKHGNTYFILSKHKHCFGYHEDHGFYSYYFDDISEYKQESDIKNQLQLWELLHRWHFNLYFEQGEFVEI